MGHIAPDRWPGVRTPVPFNLPLPRSQSAQGWKVKIRDAERVEPPHVTIIRRTTAWRFGLREDDFLDREPDPSDVPQEVLETIRGARDVLRAAWDERYPENPVESKEDDDDD